MTRTQGEAGFPYEKGTKKSDPWFVKIQRMDGRIWAGIIILLISIVLVVPLNIETPQEHFVTEVITWVESLEPGDVCLSISTMPLAGMSDMTGAMCSLYLHILLQSSRLKKLGIDKNGDGKPDGLKLILLEGLIDGQTVDDWALKQRLAKYIPDNIVYGEDYVMFPYITMSAAMYAALLDEGGFAKYFTKDYYTGKKWTDLPVTKFITSPKQVSMTMGYGQTAIVQYWAAIGGGYPIDHDPKKYKKGTRPGRGAPYAAAFPICIWDSSAPAVAAPYYQAGLFSGLLMGARHSSEYETYIHNTYHIKDDPKLDMIPLNVGFGTRTQDAASLPQLFTMIMMVVGNLGYFIQKRAEKKVESVKL